MRPFVFFFNFFYFLLAAALVAARTEIISSKDERLSYQGDWRYYEDPFVGGRFELRGLGKATLKVFNASRIGVIARLQGLDSSVQIILDNAVFMVSPIGFHEEVTWNSSILDPGVPHTISISKPFPDDGKTLELHSFPVTFPDLPTIASTPAPSSSETGALTPSSTEAEKPVMKPGGRPELPTTTKAVIAGTLACLVFLGLLGALGIYFLRRQNKNHATLNPFRKVEQGASPFQSTDALYARRDGISQFVGEGGVETETNRARKGRRPNRGTVPAHEGRRSAREGTSPVPLEGGVPSQPPPGSLSDHLSDPPPYVP